MTKSLLLTFIILTCSRLGVAQTEKQPLQRGDTDLVSELSWSPGNNLSLSASGDESSLRLWDVASDKLLWKSDIAFLQDGLELYSIRHSAWSLDQRFIATGTDNGKLQLWDAASGRLIWNAKAHNGSVTAVSISPNGKVLVSSADNGDWRSELKVWSLADGKLVKDLSADQRDINAIRFINDHRFQTSNGFGQVTTWSTTEFRSIETKRLLLCGHLTKSRANIVYSPDFTLIAVQCGESLLIRNSVGRVVGTIPREANSRRVHFSEDNSLLVLPDSEIFDIRQGRKKEFRQFDDGVFNRDGSLLAAFPSYRANGVQILDTRTGRLRGWLVGHPGVIKSLAFSNSGRRFASGGADRIVRIWDTESKQILFSLEGHEDSVESVEFSKDDKTLTSQSEKRTIIWDAERGIKLKEQSDEHLFFDQHRKRAVSPSGKLALVDEYEKPFRLVDVRTNQTIKEFVLIDQLDNLVFCPDEEHFLLKPWWGGWQLWSIKGNKPIREFGVGYSFYNRVAFHPDGKTFITGGEGQNIFMFDLDSGKTIWSLFPIDQEEFAGKKASEARRIASLDREREDARLADIENEPYKSKVYITFDHYGDMTLLGEQRIAESDTPKKSTVRKFAADSSAIWLRLHNDSPLPIEVPTQSMYLPNRKCFYEFASGQKVLGLCDNREISVWLGLEDKDGKPIPYGFDFGSSVILLPAHSVLFAVPRGILNNGNAITFSFTFQHASGQEQVVKYGNEKALRFRESDLPKQ